MCTIQTIFYVILWIFVLAFVVLGIAGLLGWYGQSMVEGLSLMERAQFRNTHPQYIRIEWMVTILVLVGLVGYFFSLGTIGLVVLHDILQRITGTKRYIAWLWSVLGILGCTLASVVSVVGVLFLSSSFFADLMEFSFFVRDFSGVNVNGGLVASVAYGFLGISWVFGVVALVRYPQFRSQEVYPKDSVSQSKHLSFIWDYILCLALTLYFMPTFFGYMVHVTILAPIAAMILFVLALYFYIGESRITAWRVILLFVFGIGTVVVIWIHWAVATRFEYVTTCEGDRMYQSMMSGWNIRWTTYRATNVPFVYERIGSSRVKEYIGGGLKPKYEALNDCLRNR